MCSNKLCVNMENGKAYIECFSKSILNNKIHDIYPKNTTRLSPGNFLYFRLSPENYHYLKNITGLSLQEGL